MIWSDYGSKPQTGEYNPDKHALDALRGASTDAEFARKLRAFNRRHQLNASFNLQRVDLIVE